MSEREGGRKFEREGKFPKIERRERERKKSQKVSFLSNDDGREEKERKSYSFSPPLSLLSFLFSFPFLGFFFTFSSSSLFSSFSGKARVEEKRKEFVFEKMEQIPGKNSSRDFILKRKEI